MRLLSALANRLWQVSNWWEWKRFSSSLGYLQATQTALLKHSLQVYSQTPWGRRFGLSEQWSYRDFSREVPLQDYQSLQPFLAASGSLCPEPVKKWEPTGGSTGGSKWIPWTPGLQGQFRRAVAPWVNDMFAQLPILRNGRSYWQLTPQAQTSHPSWIETGRTGFQSDGDYLGTVGRMLERLVLVSVEKDSPDFWKRSVALLGNASDLRYISCWSPSFLLVLKKKFEEHLGFWAPRRLWPNLRLISCWTQGPSATLSPRVRSLFPEVELAGKGLLSTEAVTTIPFQGRYPLAYRSHFFEFLGTEGVVPAWRLSQGQEYEVIQTTLGGLIRYRSGDLVRVTGFLESVPCLEFLGRSAVEDRFGEKLAHGFLQEALNRIPGFAALSFEDGGYVLFLNEDADSGFEIVRDALGSVYSYRDCLVLGQLRSLRCFVIQGDPWEQLQAHLGDDFAGRKPGVILPEGRWSSKFLGSFRND